MKSSCVSLKISPRFWDKDLKIEKFCFCFSSMSLLFVKLKIVKVWSVYLTKRIEKNCLTLNIWDENFVLEVIYRGFGRTRTIEIVKKPSGLPQLVRINLTRLDYPDSSGLPQSYPKPNFLFKTRNYFIQKTQHKIRQKTYKNKIRNKLKLLPKKLSG